MQLSNSSLTQIDLRGVRAAVASPSAFTLLEALPVRYHRAGHLPGALPIPHGDALRDVAPRLIPTLASPVIVYCASASCENSREASERLVSYGYTQVFVFEGGKAEWTAAGLPLETTGEGGAS